MNRLLLLAVCGLGAQAATVPDFATYRDFRFGMSLEDAAKPAGTKVVDATAVQRRPALIQELEWRTGFAYTLGAKRTDPVREGLLRFYNGELFQIIATYDVQRIEGLTQADLVAAISRTYGASTNPGGRVAYHTNYGDTTPILARWETDGYTASLVRTGDQVSFAFIVTQKRLEALGLASMAEAARLDPLDAPQRAVETERKTAEADRMARDKARSVNLPNFRP